MVTVNSAIPGPAGTVIHRLARIARRLGRPPAAVAERRHDRRTLLGEIAG